MAMSVDLSSLNIPQASSLVLSDSEVGFSDDEVSVVCYGSEDLFVTPEERKGKTWAQVLIQYGPRIGMTFNAEKMTMRRDAVDVDSTAEDLMMNFADYATAGVYICNTGADSKGNTRFDY